jgi:MFS superfamily sulfate permease-like transporter
MDLKNAKDTHNAGQGKLLIAKLFGALAVLAFGFALATSAYPGVLYTPTSTIVFSPSLRHWQLFTALVCALSALAYFAVWRWSTHSPNNSLSLVHFVFLAVGIVLTFLSVTSLARPALFQYNLHDPGTRPEDVKAFLLWPMRVLTISIWSVELACLVFVVNLGSVAIRNFRSRQIAS